MTIRSYKERLNGEMVVMTVAVATEEDYHSVMSQAAEMEKGLYGLCHSQVNKLFALQGACYDWLMLQPQSVQKRLT